MGGIDESALDRLSLVTEMTKHIRVKAGGGEHAEQCTCKSYCISADDPILISVLCLWR